MKYTSGLRCRECKREYSINPVHACELCFGPLEAVYDSDEFKKHVGFGKIDKNPNLWRRKKWKFMFESLPR